MPKVDPSTPHRRQSFWQITLPMILAIVVVLAAAVVAVITSGNGLDTTSVWAEVSTIWLVVPVIVTLVIFLAVAGGMIYLLARLIKGTPRVFGAIYNFVLVAGDRITAFLDALARPVMKVAGWNAACQAFWRQFKRRPQSRGNS